MHSTAPQEAADYIRQKTTYAPRVGLVLGSGLNAVAERVEAAEVVPYAEIPHFVRSTVAGHAGRLVLGVLGGVPVAVMQGRVHYYEGYTAADVTLPVRVLRLLGADVLIVTNAAGGIRPDLQPGHLMVISDHINLVGLAGHNPLRGPNEEAFGLRFPDMSDAYDAELRAIAREEAAAAELLLHEGVYAMVAGPSFETPAEVRFLRAIGADAVGMSTAPEVVVARHSGMRVLGISLISNIARDTVASGNSEAAVAPETSHTQVLATGQRAVPGLVLLLERILRRLPSSIDGRSG